MLQESVVVAQPVVETETVMVEQDPPIDPSVERAEPTLPVSTRTTGMLTSTPQLGPATITATTTAVATTEISPVTQETTVTQVSQFCLCWKAMLSLLEVMPKAQVHNVGRAVLCECRISGSLVYCQAVASMLCSVCLQWVSTDGGSSSAVSAVPVAVSKLPLLSHFPLMCLLGCAFANTNDKGRDHQLQVSSRPPH